MYEPISKIIELSAKSRFSFLLALILLSLLFLACGTDPKVEPVSGTQIVRQDSPGPIQGGDEADRATETEGQGGESQPAGSDEPYLNRPCDPVKRAGIARYEDLALPDPVAVIEDTEVVLPAAWLVFDGIAVSGFPNSYFCTAAKSIAHNLPLNRLPFDRTTVENLGSFAGKSFEILIDTDDVQRIVVSVQPWTDQKTSVYGPNAVQLTPALISRDGIRIYSFRPFSNLVQGSEYILGVRFVFPGYDEITYLWKMSG